MRIYVPHLLEEDPEDEENGSGGILFDIEGGREATTEFLLQLMAREYGIEQTTASEAFALWMVSPLLGRLEIIENEEREKMQNIRAAFLSLLFLHTISYELRKDLILKRSMIDSRRGRKRNGDK